MLAHTYLQGRCVPCRRTFRWLGAELRLMDARCVGCDAPLRPIQRAHSGRTVRVEDVDADWLRDRPEACEDPRYSPPVPFRVEAPAPLPDELLERLGLAPQVDPQDPRTWPGSRSWPKGR